MALVHGLKLDLSLTGYCLLTPTFLLFLFSLTRSQVFRHILDTYTFILLLLLIPLFFTNLVVYKFWNYPIDRSIYDYLNTPEEMFASLGSLRLILVMAMVIFVIYVSHFRIYRKWISKPLLAGEKAGWLEPASFLIFLPLLILPIRGGFRRTPISTGWVYFHQNAYINHIAVNPVWNLGYTLHEGKKLTQTVSYLTDHEAREIMQALHANDADPLPILNNGSPNIILILLESFSVPVLAEFSDNDEVIPEFNAMIPEGIFFNRIYASGTRTDRALGSVLGGYPGIPGTCVIYYEQKTHKLPNLNIKLKSDGYGSAFLYGGDIEFAHIKSFLNTGGFDKIISERDFDNSLPRSNWGVPDHFLFQRLLEETDKASSPFFHILLTLSSHTPFDVPMQPKFPGSDDKIKYLNSIHYTDKALGAFISEAKTRDWWDETLVILMADHGCRVGNLTEHEEMRFRIPMLWLGGALSVQDTVITNYGSQTDLPCTLLNQLRLPCKDFQFSNDLLSENPNSFAYYTFHDGIGFITDSTYAVYSLTTESYLIEKDMNFGKDLNKGLAYLQFLLADFNKL
jgi:phosphoglycerol transferase MdoB-like AlkP superfamily enzyme